MNKLRLRIKNLRNELNLTQVDVAEQMGISVSAYSRIENDPGNVVLDRYIELAKILNVELTKLLEGLDSIS